MTLLAAVLGLLFLGITGYFFGVDSTERPRSKEEELAEFGVTWEDLYPKGESKPDSAPKRPTQKHPAF